MVTFAHISDLHFGRERDVVVNSLLRTLKSIQPELIIVSGDITQRAKKKEFIAARSFFKALTEPLLIISGNHDIPAYPPHARLFNPWKRWQLHLGYELEPIVRGAGFTAIGVNTVRRVGSLFDWSRGRINSEQTLKIERQLKEESDTQLRIIVAHHPFWLPRKFIHRQVVDGQAQALKMLKGCGADLILGGHVHLAYTHLLQGLIVSHAGTAVSTRSQPGTTNSFKVIKGDRKKLSFETFTWNDQCFISSEHVTFIRQDGEWAEAFH